MPTETWNVGPVVLGGLDQEFTLLDLMLYAVDGDRHELGLCVWLDIGHAETSERDSGHAPSVM